MADEKLTAALAPVDRLAAAVPDAYDDLVAQFPRMRGRVLATDWERMSACERALRLIEGLDEAANDIEAPLPLTPLQVAKRVAREVITAHQLTGALGSGDPAQAVLDALADAGVALRARREGEE